MGGEKLASEAAEIFWQALREGSLLQPRHDQTLWRWSGASDTLANTVPNTSLINWAGAERWVLTETSDTPLEGLVQYQGGDRLAEVYGAISAPQQALQQRIKHAFDPHGILNAGRLYAWM